MTLKEGVASFLDGAISITTTGGSGTIVYEASFEVGGLDSVCCFSLVGPHNVQEFLKKYECKFGGHAVVIRNVPAFVQQSKKALTQQGLNNVESGQVTYVPKGVVDNYMQAIFDPYIKTSEYSSEFEYRFSYRGGGPASKIGDEIDAGRAFAVGSIAEFTEIVASDQLSHWINEYFPKQN